MDKLRGLFDTVATRWANAFPTSADAKESLALSLELRGDAAAVDTLKAAERLATDPGDRIRLAATRIALQLKFTVSGSGGDLGAVRVAAESLLDAEEARANPSTAAMLAPLAAITGQCQRASALLRRSATPIAAGGVRASQDVAADIGALEGYVFVGCRPPDPRKALEGIALRLDMSQPTDSARLTAEYLVLGGVVRALVPPDSVWVSRLATPSRRTMPQSAMHSLGVPTRRAGGSR